jgi:hypothetical protein
VKPGISSGGSSTTSPESGWTRRRGTTAIRSLLRRISGSTRKLVTDSATRRAQALQRLVRHTMKTASVIGHQRMVQSAEALQ